MHHSNEAIRNHQQCGFSLPSMIMAIGIATVLLGTFINCSKHWISERQADADRHHLITLITRARLVSLLEHQPLVVCASSDRKTCHIKWQEGVLLATKGSRGTPSNVLTYLPLHPDITLHGTNGLLVFNPEPAANILSATFVFCTPHGIGYPLVVNRVGRVRLESARRHSRCITGYSTRRQ